MSRPPLLLTGLVLAVGAGGSAALAQSAPAPLKWAPCGDVPETECARLELPVDYANPNGAKVSRCGIGRVPAVDPAKRKGVLLICRAAPARALPRSSARCARSSIIPRFSQQYDVVSFDPRGIGKSNPIRCDPQAAPKVEMPMDRKPTQAGVRRGGGRQRRFLQELRRRHRRAVLASFLQGHRRGHRAHPPSALTPNEGIVSYAASYGSEYGPAYLETYPQNVKVLVLDAVMDHTIDYPAFLARNVMSVQDSFERMEEWCAKEAKCPLHGKDLGAASDAAIAREPKMRTLVPQMLAGGDEPQYGWPMVSAADGGGQRRRQKQDDEGNRRRAGAEHQRRSVAAHRHGRPVPAA